MPKAATDEIQVQRLYLQIYKKISTMIHNGDFQPGERLPSERALAEQFNVSRPPLREAIIALEVMGLVEVKPGSGVYVREQAEETETNTTQEPEDLPGPFEILEARMHFEAAAAALAAERIGNNELQLLSQLLGQLKQFNEDKDADAAEKVDQQFHMVIADACRNSAITSTIRWLWELRNQSEISAQFHQDLRTEGSLPTIQDHEDILSALMQRDSQLAREAMQKHLQRVITNLTQHSAARFK
ncbi:FadR/GntR family transcriptional regulator [Maricurvus nonylphenolicus]|uniref:FadR/GntR family transcriptional regulator n=1 Tax=Maricurvus nonylphenolicus TaxID=1008307 RepID=UPI0036F29108